MLRSAVFFFSEFSPRSFSLRRLIAPCSPAFPPLACSFLVFGLISSCSLSTVARRIIFSNHLFSSDLHLFLSDFTCPLAETTSSIRSRIGDKRKKTFETFTLLSRDSGKASVSPCSPSHSVDLLRHCVLCSSSGRHPSLFSSPAAKHP